MTQFSAATFSGKNEAAYGRTVQEIWLVLVMIWTLVFSRYPNQLRSKKGFVYISDWWKKLTDLNEF